MKPKDITALKLARKLLAENERRDVYMEPSWVQLAREVVRLVEANARKRGMLVSALDLLTGVLFSDRADEAQEFIDAATEEVTSGR